MEQLFSELATHEVKRLTLILKDSEDELINLYRSYPAFNLMYEQYKDDTSGTYTFLCSICYAYTQVLDKQITDREAVKLYGELLSEAEEKNHTIQV